MNEEEKKALRVINTRTRRLLDELEIEKEDMSDEPRIAYLMQEIRANKTILNLIEKLQKENESWKSYSEEIEEEQTEMNNKNCELEFEVEKLQKENEKLKNIRYDTPYGTETIHLIPESNLIEINTHKYMIEVEPGKFVDLKQVYLENKKLNEYKENYIPVQGIKDELEELKGKLEDISKRRKKSKIKEEETVLWCLEIRTDERIKTLQELLDKMDQNQ